MNIRLESAPENAAAELAKSGFVTIAPGFFGLWRQ